MTTTYSVTLADGNTFLMRGDMEQASAPLSANYSGDADGWVSSPYQTADAQHRPEKAAEILAEYFRADMEECAEVVSVEAQR